MAKTTCIFCRGSGLIEVNSRSYNEIPRYQETICSYCQTVKLRAPTSIEQERALSLAIEAFEVAYLAKGSK